MINRTISLLLVTLSLFVPQSGTGLATETSPPAAAGSLAPNLAVGLDGRALLSWLEPVKPKTWALRFSIHDKSGWTTPRTITSGNDWFVSGADFPSVAYMKDGTLAANSLIATNRDLEAYNTSVFLSHDGGGTWSKPVLIHRDKKVRQHGFVSFAPLADGRLGAVWLDGRQLSKSNEGDMALFYTSIGKDGSKGEAVLDTRVCECCQTAAVATPDGMLVVYRDRSPKEVRDISIVRLQNGKWSTPTAVATDGWVIDACPVNGPSISASGQNVAVAWFTVVNDKSRVFVALSTDGGKTFGKAIKVDDGNPLGHVDVASTPTGGAIVSWMERAARSEVRIRSIEANGTTLTAQTISGADGVSGESFPRIKRTGSTLYATWTSSGDTSAIHTVTIPIR